MLSESSTHVLNSYLANAEFGFQYRNGAQYLSGAPISGLLSHTFRDYFSWTALRLLDARLRISLQLPERYYHINHNLHQFAP